MFPLCKQTSCGPALQPNCQGRLFEILRPLPAAVEVMRFWDLIFPEAMTTLKARYEEPKGRSKAGYSIQARPNGRVYDQLQDARDSYDTPKGFVGHVKKGFRKVVDNVQPVRQAIKFVPNTDYTFPVLAVVQIILEVSCIQKTKC
jgi:hypothetical protein